VKRPVPAAAMVYDLKAEDLDLIQLFADGYSTPEICDIFGVTPPTVHKHTLKISQRLGARNRTQMVYLAVKKGLIA
jgi:DNA-binding NarL/FixJ family response regulator